MKVNGWNFKKNRKILCRGYYTSQCVNVVWCTSDILVPIAIYCMWLVDLSTWVWSGLIVLWDCRVSLCRRWGKCGIYLEETLHLSFPPSPQGCNNYKGKKWLCSKGSLRHYETGRWAEQWAFFVRSPKKKKTLCFMILKWMLCQLMQYWATLGHNHAY